MDAVLELVEGLRTQVASHADSLALKYDVSSSCMPLGALNMVHQELTRALELLSYYKTVFPKPKRGRFEDFLNDHAEESQRVISLLRSCFIASVSSYESCARKALNNFSGDFGNVPRGIYLVNIMQRSRKIGWITPLDEKAWEQLIKIRNFIVHNNGESDRSDTYVFPNGVMWRLLEGFSTEITLRHIPLLLEWSIQAYSKWCDSFLGHWRGYYAYLPESNKWFIYICRSKSKRIIPSWCSNQPSKYSTSIIY